MQFIEMTGKTLMQVVGADDATSPEELARVGVDEHTVVRINRQGDIEVRRQDRWDIVGGLLGDFEERIKREASLDWADCGRHDCGMHE